MPPPAILLHFGGAGTYTAAATIAALFVVLFALSFVVARRPQGAGTWSREWLSAWINASLPRLLITGLFCTGLFVASSTTGGSGSGAEVCRKPLAPLSSAPVTAERLEAAVEGMRNMAGAAAAGDIAGAQAFFFGDTHNVTHDIDRPLRDADDGLARELCRSIVTLELELADKRDGPVIAREGATAARLMEQAAVALDLSP